MKILFITLFFSLTSLSIAQQIVNERDFIEALERWPGEGEIRVVTTRIDEGSSWQDKLTPGHEIKKVNLKAEINKSDFDVKYFLEEYLNNHVKTEDMAWHSSFRSSYVGEIIINRMTDNRLSIIMQSPAYIAFRYMLPKEKSHYKWKIFTETPFEKNAPVCLIYSENPDDTTLEQKVEKLFSSPSFKNLKDKDIIAEQIKTVTNHFYLFLYDVIIK